MEAQDWCLREQRFSEQEPEFRVLLVSDLVAFTSTVEGLGDREGLQFIRRHNAMLRRCLELEAGIEIAHTGDGMIMSFTAADSALRCAASILRMTDMQNTRMDRSPMHVRLGVHAGHPHIEEERLFGTCVNVAVRVCATAVSQQILISSTVVDLVDLSRYPLENRGPVTLRGVTDPVQLYELDWRSAYAEGVN